MAHWRLFVGGLPRDSPDAARAFAQRLAKAANANAIVAVDIASDAATGAFKGYAHVTLEPREADLSTVQLGELPRALSALNGLLWQGRRIRVEHAQPDYMASRLMVSSVASVVLPATEVAAPSKWLRVRRRRGERTLKVPIVPVTIESVGAPAAVASSAATSAVSLTHQAVAPSSIMVSLDDLWGGGFSHIAGATERVKETVVVPDATVGKAATDVAAEAPPAEATARKPGKQPGKARGRSAPNRGGGVRLCIADTAEPLICPSAVSWTEAPLVSKLHAWQQVALEATLAARERQRVVISHPVSVFPTAVASVEALVPNLFGLSGSDQPPLATQPDPSITRDDTPSGVGVDGLPTSIIALSKCPAGRHDAVGHCASTPSLAQSSAPKRVATAHDAAGSLPEAIGATLLKQEQQQQQPALKIAGHFANPSDAPALISLVAPTAATAAAKRGRQQSRAGSREQSRALTLLQSMMGASDSEGGHGSDGDGGVAVSVLPTVRQTLAVQQYVGRVVCFDDGEEAAAAPVQAQVQAKRRFDGDGDGDLELRSHTPPQLARNASSLSEEAPDAAVPGGAVGAAVPKPVSIEMMDQEGPLSADDAVMDQGEDDDCSREATSSPSADSALGRPVAAAAATADEGSDENDDDSFVFNAPASILVASRTAGGAPSASSSAPAVSNAKKKDRPLDAAPAAAAAHASSASAAAADAPHQVQPLSEFVTLNSAWRSLVYGDAAATAGRVPATSATFGDWRLGKAREIVAAPVQFVPSVAQPESAAMNQEFRGVRVAFKSTAFKIGEALGVPDETAAVDDHGPAASSGGAAASSGGAAASSGGADGSGGGSSGFSFGFFGANAEPLSAEPNKDVVAAAAGKAPVGEAPASTGTKRKRPLGTTTLAASLVANAPSVLAAGDADPEAKRVRFSSLPGPGARRGPVAAATAAASSMQRPASHQARAGQQRGAPASHPDAALPSATAPPPAAAVTAAALLEAAHRFAGVRRRDEPPLQPGAGEDGAAGGNGTGPGGRLPAHHARWLKADFRLKAKHVQHKHGAGGSETGGGRGKGGSRGGHRRRSA